MKKSNITALAMAIAGGRSIASWCKETGVSRRTGYRLSKTPECQRLVHDIRRRAIDRAIGQLARHAARASAQIARLSSSAGSEAIRLNASRAVLADLLAVQGHAELEQQIQELKRRLDAQEARRAKRNAGA